MGLVSPSQSSPGDEITASRINTPVNQLAAVVNGGIDDANLEDGAVSTAKLADSAVTGAKIAAGAVIEIDGWTTVSDSWTYASATTITVPSDATTKYSVGDKIRLSQTTVKYFYITAVAATTLTITGGTSYTLTNAAITDVSYSKASTPLGFPQYFTWTPTWTNLTISSSTVDAEFAMVGKTVHFRLDVIAAGSFAVTSSPVYFTLPVTSGYPSATPMGHGLIQDVSAGGFFFSQSWIGDTTARGRILIFNAGISILGASDISSSLPMNPWANGDIIRLSGTYEAA